MENCVFKNFELEKIEDLLPIIKNYKNLIGFAVTKPFKQKIFKYLDEQDKVVEKIESCNCVLIKNNKLIGYNTDVLGFEQSLITNLKPYHKKALVLGNGGAAQAVKYVLRKLHIDYKTVTRNGFKRYTTYNDLTKNIIEEHQIIINTTPVGTYPIVQECPNILYEFLTPKHYLFDLVYNPSITTFMSKGLQHGAFVKNGYEMLCLQAEANWKIWNDL